MYDSDLTHRYVGMITTTHNISTTTTEIASTTSVELITSTAADKQMESTMESASGVWTSVPGQYLITV